MSTAKKNLASPSSEAESTGFNVAEKEMIYAKVEKITGTSQRGRYRKDILIGNIEKRMHEVNLESIKDYLQFAENDPEERKYLISAMTIHTTSFFRELPHYNIVEKIILENISEFVDRPLTMYCAACSTGEEVYSFALLMESIRTKHPKFDYKILGCDIDPVSVEKGKKAVYRLDTATTIPQKFQSMLLKGSGKTEGLFTFDKEIRKRCDFGVANLRDKQLGVSSYDIVTCRNALIYFEPNIMNGIVGNLVRLMKPNGLFIVGTSDFIEPDKHKLKDLGKSVYVIEGQSGLSGHSSAPKVLIVDDSLTIRNSMSKLLIKEGFRVDTAESAQEATEYLRKEKPSLITLDLHMPGMDGQTWLTQQRANGLTTPVIIISGASPSEAKSVLNALGNGAQDYFEKEALMNNPIKIVEGLRAIIDTYQSKKDKKPKLTPPISGQSKLKVSPKRPSVVVMGASTGGTEALVRVLEKMPLNSPPIVIVQHINHNYAKPFHERLCRLSGLQMAEAVNGGLLKDGHIYMSHSDIHIELIARNDEIRIKTSNMGPINGVRPAVDCLFRSATFLGNKVCAVLLTGMGKDGAAGMLELRKKGAITIAQDEDSCVVYGMPKAAIEMGAAMVVGNLGDIRAELRAILDSKLK